MLHLREDVEANVDARPSCLLGEPRGVVQQQLLVAELKKSYPGADFASVQVIEEGREFPTEQKLLLMLGGAVALIVAGAVAGVVLLAVKRRKRAQPASAAEEMPG